MKKKCVNFVYTICEIMYSRRRVYEVKRVELDDDEMLLQLCTCEFICAMHIIRGDDS